MGVDNLRCSFKATSSTKGEVPLPIKFFLKNLHKKLDKPAYLAVFYRLCDNALS